jgi:undecaprenyl pyrophosphate phosphatase UppP
MCLQVNGLRNEHARKCFCMLHFYVIAIMQIVLESFPVSSSGHLQLFEKIATKNFSFDKLPSSPNEGYAGLSTMNGFVQSAQLSAEQFQTFYKLLHGITLIVIALFFYKRWVMLLKAACRNPYILIKCCLFTLAADIVTTVLFLVWHVLPINFPLVLGFSITACTLFSLYFCSSDKRSVWNLQSALVLGFVQGIALLPGISRFASTYVAARWLKLPSHKAFEISFLIEWPLIFAAFIVTLVTKFHSSSVQQFLNPTMGLTILGAGAAAYVGLLIVSWCAEKNRMQWFGYYMIIPIIIGLFCT